MSRVVVVGIGRVGLPLALYLADHGHSVVGLDVDENRVSSIQAGKMPFREEGAEEVLARVVEQGRFVASSDPEACVSAAEILILTLGTPVDEHLNPVFTNLEAVFDTLGPLLRPDQLLILRSTVSPGTTEYLRRHIEKTTELRVGEDLLLAFCPERIAQGHSFRELPKIPQIVGTLDAKSEARAVAFFEPLVVSVHTSDARSAEIAKLFCNVYRYIDFAIGNEFMMLADQQERDIYKILKLVNEGYPRGGLKSPGFTGGPCLYKDGFFLVDRIPFPDLLTTAWKINESVPAYLIGGLRQRLGTLEGKQVLVLGLAFKREIDDNRNSLAYKAVKVLRRYGAEVATHDPYLAPGDLKPLLTKADAVLIATNHHEYQELDHDLLRDVGETLVADVWNVFGVNEVFFSLPGGLPQQASSS
ncbi:MAG: nucleotide sugar dehydrogenase [Planctomycetes bacterium]|nr:nucleotide sugar dehydrogenase [Planctomycetota bacterium]